MVGLDRLGRLCRGRRGELRPAVAAAAVAGAPRPGRSPMRAPRTRCRRRRAADLRWSPRRSASSSPATCSVYPEPADCRSGWSLRPRSSSRLSAAWTTFIRSRSLPRLLLQAVAVAIVMVALPDELRVAPFLPVWIERALLGFALLWFVNLTNFMDGIDWMTVAEVVPVSAGLVAARPDGRAAARRRRSRRWRCAARCSASRRSTARWRGCFSATSAACRSGCCSAGCLIVLAGSGHVAAALLLPLYYLADATVTLLRRRGEGRAGLAGAPHPFLSAGDRQRFQRHADRRPRVPVEHRA